MHHVALAAVPLAKIILISIAWNVFKMNVIWERPNTRPLGKTWNNPTLYCLGIL